MMNRRCNYHIVKETPEYIMIKDDGPWDQYMSVTNGAESVVKELAPKLNGRKLFYLDSEGYCDRIIYVGDTFTEFGFGGPND